MDGEALRKHTAANRRYIQMGYMPGIAECVLRDNRLVYADMQGYQDVELQLPMTERSLHRCFSLTKPITAFGLMVLRDKGKLRLDDPVGKYIPAFKNVTVLKDKSATGPGPRGGGVEPPKRPMTLRHLVTHTSGLGYGPGRTDKEDKLDPGNSMTEAMYLELVQDIDDCKVSGLEEFCDRLAKLPLRFHPGDQYRYSMGMDVIGRVLEVVSNMPLDEFLQRMVFTPLGMRDTTFAVTPRRARRQLTALYHTTPCNKHRTTQLPSKFTARRRDGQQPEASAWVRGQAMTVLSGGGIMGSYAGGLVSSLRDQALFCAAVANLGFAHATGLQVLKPHTLRLMCKNWLRLKSVTRKVCLKGWYDEPGCESMGWCPLGFCDQDTLFMGGIGCWSINLTTKTICVSMSNAWSEHNDVHGWVDEVDELEGAVKTATDAFSSCETATTASTPERCSSTEREEMAAPKRPRKS